ncbi:hypothetical protein JOB18_011168 [Solea senegalensis]|uniref:Uncharacterized protein n=1 Tax=Solea senegalensis TaxID=28829 RepID=A0AAV6QEI3_SOLSE|nr:hypothetical protein JOB18_011168 [Solea senegalensis]
MTSLRVIVVKPVQQNVSMNVQMEEITVLRLQEILPTLLSEADAQVLDIVTERLGAQSHPDAHLGAVSETHPRLHQQPLIQRPSHFSGVSLMGEAVPLLFLCDVSAALSLFVVMPSVWCAPAIVRAIYSHCSENKAIPALMESAAFGVAIQLQRVKSQRLLRNNSGKNAPATEENTLKRS